MEKVLLRWLGGKSKMVKKIAPYLLPLLQGESYAEPFLGGGSMAIWIARNQPQIKRLYLNDIDEDLAAIWTVVTGQEPGVEDMCQQLIDLEKQMDDPAQRMECYKTVRNYEPRTIQERAFRYFFLNKTSYGGKPWSTPIGGWEQDGWKGRHYQGADKNGVSCQYHAKEFADTIRDIHKHTNGRALVSAGDAIGFLKDLPSEVPSYVDPPYFAQYADRNYKFKMTLEQHQALAEVLRGRGHWVLSYEDCPQVRELYSWATVITEQHVYTASKAENRTKPKNELLIMPNEHPDPVAVAATPPPAKPKPKTVKKAPKPDAEPSVSAAIRRLVKEAHHHKDRYDQFIELAESLFGEDSL